MKLADEIIALLDREGVSQIATVMILTEVASRRAFPDAVLITLEGLRMEDIRPTTAEGRQRARERQARKRRRCR
jgi:hypothetical protein